MYPRISLLEKHKKFIHTLKQNNHESAFWLTLDTIQIVKNYSTDKSSVLFDCTDIPSNAILLHTHHEADLTHLSDRDVQTSQELNIPVAVWHTTAQTLDFYDPSFPHPYPLQLKGDLTWKDYLNLDPHVYRCNCYTLAADVAKALFKREYPKLNFYNVDYITAFKNPEALGFKKVKTLPSIGDIALMYLSPDIPYHIAQIFSKTNNDFFAIHIVGGKHTSALINLSKWKNNIVSYWRY